MFGYSNECESYNSAKARTKNAVKFLIEQAQIHTQVALVGHGFFNQMIAKELRKSGWKSPKKTSAKHWICAAFTTFDQMHAT